MRLGLSGENTSICSGAHAAPDPAPACPEVCDGGMSESAVRLSCLLQLPVPSGKVDV